ncbi:hypothetical protein BG262_05730 [Floricoccus penangensis]|uniref:HTH cro/C1-type domain-containing protein n=1 Tax=Floricoccus penangensis TaxID=1859475 RepID=A0A9Q5NYV6_9LACT|nr:helix-turn-helix transcriptional regulator [Floricoccus penangensis]OFI45985.1 hypothetical protein BG262_05730 [Floricoccus penangensis]
MSKDIHFSKKIIKLRTDKKLTQEDLANAMGITKASVSKWENRQSYPDITLLPRLASYFDVTIDDLLGYEPNLTKEEIREYYEKFTDDFVNLSFEEVKENVEREIFRYYSCYPFLFHMALLYMNHAELASSIEGVNKILSRSSELCKRIIENSDDNSLVNNAIMLKSSCDLMTGHAEETKNILEDILDPSNLSNQSDILLIRAYLMLGEINKAKSFNQFSLFKDLSNIVSNSAQYLSMNLDNIQVVEETIKRTDSLIETYKLDRLNQNSVASYNYFCALAYASLGKRNEAIERLNLYLDLSFELLDLGDKYLHGDEYFDLMDSIIEEQDMGSKLVRGKKTIVKSMAATLTQPVFTSMSDDPSFIEIQDRISRKENSYDNATNS